MDLLLSRLSLTQFRRLFYLILPSETSFERMADVPHYFDEATSWFVVLVFLEAAVLRVTKEHTGMGEKLTGSSTNDMLTSINGGLFQLLVGKIRLPLYIMLLNYTHNNWRIIDLPWDSIYTWILCLIVTDFLYYVFHRATHEIGILWTVHQMHHSSEYYNLTTALRQSGLQNIPYMAWDVTKVCFFPVPVVMVHNYFNTLYQFWIHTELIPPLGPLEYVINTPSAHRVHHGRNPYCIDKNYAGTLMIWDILFGTYEPERKEKIVYGLVEPVNSFNQLYLQFFELKIFLWDKPNLMTKWSDKLKAVFYPPGWLPGKKLKFFLFWFHLADTTDGIPQIDANMVTPYNPPLPQWKVRYAWVHELLSFVVYIAAAEKFSSSDDMRLEFWLHVAWQIAGMQSSGALFDHSPWCSWLELSKNGMAVLYAGVFWWSQFTTHQLLFTLYSALCVIFWGAYILRDTVRVNIKVQ